MTGPLDLAAQAAIAAIGTEVRSEEFRTGSHRLAQFAAALGAKADMFRVGQIAVPTFAHIPVMQSMVEVLGRVSDGLMMHGEHDFVFHRPITPGQRLHTLSRLAGVRSNAAGLLVTVRSETWLHTGDAVCTQYSTCILRGRAEPVAIGEAVPDRPQVPDGVTRTDSFAISPSLTEGYAEAARDYSPYCLVPEDARAAGFESPIVYGMLSLSLAALAVVDQYAARDPARLRRLGCRFAQPLFSRPGETLAITHHANAEAGLVGFAASDGAGRAIMTRGYAEIAQ